MIKAVIKPSGFLYFIIRIKEKVGLTTAAVVKVNLGKHLFFVQKKLQHKTMDEANHNFVYTTQLVVRAKKIATCFQYSFCLHMLIKKRYETGNQFWSGIFIWIFDKTQFVKKISFEHL